MTKANVFALPMVRRSNEMLDSYGVFICDYTDEACAEFAVNAINHADALADALESIIGLVDVTNEDELSALDLAKAALAAYRGAK